MLRLFWEVEYVSICRDLAGVFRHGYGYWRRKNRVERWRWKREMR